jgi:hypothetical protein
MPTSPLDQPGRATQTHSTELIRDPFSYPYAIDQRGQLFLIDKLERLSNPLSPSNAVDALAAAVVGSTALQSIGWNRVLPAIGAHLEFNSLLAGAIGILSASWHQADEVVDYLWEGLVQPSFKPMYGRATQADRALVSMSTRGRIRSREIQPEYEEED